MSPEMLHRFSRLRELRKEAMEAIAHPAVRRIPAEDVPRAYPLIGEARHWAEDGPMHSLILLGEIAARNPLRDSHRETDSPLHPWYGWAETPGERKPHTYLGIESVRVIMWIRYLELARCVRDVRDVSMCGLFLRVPRVSAESPTRFFALPDTSRDFWPEEILKLSSEELLLLSVRLTVRVAD